MKAIYLLSFILFCFMYTSCDKEDPIINYVDKEELFNNNKPFDKENTTIIWNGDTVDLSDNKMVWVKLRPEAADSNKLELNIDEFFPTQMNIPINIESNIDKITFYGSSSGQPYDLEVHGTFIPASGKRKKTLELNCQYKVNEEWLELEYPYVFRFDKQCMILSVMPGGTVTWNGQTFDNGEFFILTLREMCRRISEKVTALKFIFHADGTVTIYKQKNGEDFALFTVLGYSLGRADFNQKTIYLEFSEEQADYFTEQYMGPDENESPFFYYSVDHREYLVLSLNDWDDKMWLNFPAQYQPKLLKRYINHIGSKGLSDIEKQRLEIFTVRMAESEWFCPIYFMSY